MKAKVQSRNREKAAEDAEAGKASLTKGQQNVVEQASERGGSTWLTAIPMTKYGFQLSKQALRDALCLRYGLSQRGCPHTAHVGRCSQWHMPSAVRKEP